MQSSVSNFDQKGRTSKIAPREPTRQIETKSHEAASSHFFSADRNKRHWLCFVRAVAFALLMAVGVTTAHQLHAKDAYAVTYGDTIQISINGPAAIEKDVMVGSDGTVVFPYFGRFDAIGKTLASLEEDIFSREDLTTLRQVTADGSEFWVKLRPSELTLDIAEYRPVFVQGAVETPGSLQFSPGLTVRQAVAASGGILRVDDTDFVQQRKATVASIIQLARSQLQTRQDVLLVLKSRLEANLETLEGSDPALKSQLASVTSDLQRSRVALLEEERNANQQVQLLLQNRLETLGDRRNEEETLVLLNQERVARNQALADRGLLVEDRRNEAERALSIANVRAFETDDDLARIQIESTRLGVQDALQSQKSKLSLFEQIESLELEAEDLRSTIAAREQEYRDLSGVISESTIAEEFEFYLYSANEDSSGEGKLVTPDIRMAPGDVLDVRLSRK